MKYFCIIDLASLLFYNSLILLRFLLFLASRRSSLPSGNIVPVCWQAGYVDAYVACHVTCRLFCTFCFSFSFLFFFFLR